MENSLDAAIRFLSVATGIVAVVVVLVMHLL